MVLANGFVDLDVVLNPVAEDVVAAVANWQSAHLAEATVFETAGLVMLLAQPVSGLDEIMEQFLEARMGLRLADKEEVVPQSRTRRQRGWRQSSSSPTTAAPSMVWKYCVLD